MHCNVAQSKKMKHGIPDHCEKQEKQEHQTAVNSPVVPRAIAILVIQTRCTTL